VGQVLLGNPDDGLVDVTEGDVLDGLVLQHLTDNTAVATTDDKDVTRVRVGSHGKVGDHLLVAGRRKEEKTRE
jgi:hypothetical protein